MGGGVVRPKVNYPKSPNGTEGDSDFNQLILKILSMHCKYFVHSEP